LLRVTRKKYPHARISVIAHSYGSYIIGRLLKEQVDLELDRLILCGSVLPASYPWEEVVHKFIDGSNGNIPNVINEYGEKDAWPVLAKAASWGYGDSGTWGFGHVFVQDRNHNIEHNEYLTRDFVTTYWKPFIENGEYKPIKSKVDPSSWLLSVIGLLPLRWIIVLIVLIVLAIPLSLFLGWVMSSEPTPPSVAYRVAKSPDVCLERAKKAMEVKNFKVTRVTRDTETSKVVGEKSGYKGVVACIEKPSDVAIFIVSGKFVSGKSYSQAEQLADDLRGEFLSPK